MSGFEHSNKDSDMPNESRMKNDPVNHPDHYTFGGIECIDAIHAQLGDAGFVAFCRGTAAAYVWRTGRKDGTSQDLAKAAWYLNRAEKVAQEMEAQGTLALEKEQSLVMTSAMQGVLLAMEAMERSGNETATRAMILYRERIGG